ncbi:hypothetical protein R1sor_023795 [Riccia sorocarpa]|uniref:Reverse transcriptase n=1 Tax=Riccia sorocarpa TaxID=122646 RepID=A0ABD3GUK5_9MARC
MAHLVDENGNQVTEEEDVLRLIHGYYRDLYTQPELDEGTVVEIREVLDTIDRTITEREKVTLTSIPDKEELEDLIKQMAKGKAPGEDGVTIETIDEALINKQKGGTLTVLVAVACQQIWADRNAHIFRNQRSNIPTRVMLLKAFQEIDATLTSGAT